MPSGSTTEAVTATASNSHHLPRPPRWWIAQAAIPNANASPMTLAAIECSRFSIGSKSALPTHDRVENAAAAVIRAPKSVCIAAAQPPQPDRRCNANPITDRPNSRNPSRASQAPCTAWAADSLVVCVTQE